MCKPNATITVASRPFLYDFTVTRGSEPVPYRAFLHECCRYPEERKFLGFSIASDGSERRIAPQALAKFKARIRDLTSRTRGISLHRMIETLKPYLLGWRGYFGFCQTPHVLTSLERWIRRRLRAYLWRQWNNGPKRFRELRRRGLSTFQAAIAAGSPTACWRMARHVAVQQALRNHHFDSLGLPRLYMRIPEQSDHRIRSKVISHSGGK